MTAPVVLIRADGGPGIGGGHIVRAIVLSEALAADGCDVHLLTKDNGWIRAAAGRFRCKVHFLRAADNESLIVVQTARRLGARLILMDVQDTSAEYVRYLQESGAAVITIDDRGRGAELADATFMAGAAARREKNYYYGPAYAILAPRILELRKTAAAPEQIRTAVIFLGTFDPRHHAKLVPALADRFPAVSFRWFSSEAGMNRPNLQVIQSAQDVFLDHLSNADLAVVSGGVSMFEAAALGRPAIILPQARHESDQAAVFAAAGAALLPESPSVEHTAHAVESLLAAPQKLHEMHSQGMALVDGRGLERVRDVVRRLLRPIHAA